MFRRGRGRGAVPPELVGLAADFAATVELVEAARAALLTAVPSGRGAGAPLAEALAGFEWRLGVARATMDRWRASPIEPTWQACSAALDDAATRAEHLRLEAMPRGYEELYGALGDLIEPLEVFEQAAGLFDGVGLDRP